MVVDGVGVVGGSDQLRITSIDTAAVVEQPSSNLAFGCQPLQKVVHVQLSHTQNRGGT